MVPHGADIQAQVGVLLLARQSCDFPSPLTTPLAEALRMGEWDCHAALEAFSGFSTLLSLESLLHQLSLLPELTTTVPSTVLCSQLLPLVHSATWQLAPATSLEFGCTMASCMACWRQAVAPLPPTAQSALLSTDPFSPGFGSVQAVTEALAWTPSWQCQLGVG